MNARRLRDDRGLFPICARLAWQEMATACKFKAARQVQFAFGLFEFLWIIREIFGNDMLTSISFLVCHTFSGIWPLVLLR
jgi:hypothetical protein